MKSPSNDNLDITIPKIINDISKTSKKAAEIAQASLSSRMSPTPLNNMGKGNNIAI